MLLTQAESVPPVNLLTSEHEQDAQHSFLRVCASVCVCLQVQTALRYPEAQCGLALT